MPTKNILLVEDNPDDRELMRLAFAQGTIPHNLVVVSDGIEALNYLQRQTASNIAETIGDRDLLGMPSLIILDLNLPKINGIEVLRRIRAHPLLKVLPVVVISSSSEPQDLIDSYVNGCNSYIRKPVHFTQLQIFVREISTYWLTVNQLPPVFGVLNE
ncbi:MAG: response regulator [Cyanobacteria bacterium J06621_8]